MTLLQVRETDARRKSSWYAGEGKHPHGLSGEAALLPSELTASCWDTAPHAWRFSEWGRLAGFE